MSHSANNLTLLCSQHHAEATKGLLTKVQIEAANQNPCNIRTGVTRPFGLHFQGPQFETTIGSNTFMTGGLGDQDGTRHLIAVSIDDHDILSAAIDSDGNLFLTLEVFDECNLPILLINNNTLLVWTGTWDISFQSKVLTIREAARDILFEVVFEPPHRIVIPRGRILLNGIEVVIREEHIFVANSQTLLSHNVMAGPAIGLQLGRNLRGIPAAMSCEPKKLKRYTRRRSTTAQMERAVIKRRMSLLKEVESRFAGELE